MPGLVFWEEGEVFLASSTFERLILLAGQHLPDPDDQEELSGMLAVGAFKPDAYDEPRRSRFVGAVARAAEQMVRESEGEGEPERAMETQNTLNELLAELRRRHPQAGP